MTGGERVRAAVVGSGFAAHLHAEALLATGRVDLVGVVAPSEASRRAFTQRWGGRPYATLEHLLVSERPDVVSLAMPNRFHCEATVLAAGHGAHVICEKPLAMNLAEADLMIEACRRAGVLLLYAEQLCFAPRYRRVKELVDAGAFGDLIQITHRERHGGPHAAWFHDPELSGGGALLDMGCHGVALVRWLLGNRPVEDVHAHLGRYRHRIAVEDHALVTLRFADAGTNGPMAVIDASWAAPGGIDERLEILGTEGSVVADLARGQSLLVHTTQGVGYATEKAEHTLGWTFVAHEEARTWGWYDEMAHFVDCVEGRATPELTGEDGRAVLALVMEAYRSAASRDAAPPRDR